VTPASHDVIASFAQRAARERSRSGRFNPCLETTDGYVGYGKVGGKEMVHAACWAHARRYFFQAVQLNGKDLVALGIVVEIDKLFEIEADAKSADLGAGKRLEMRREKAEPILKVPGSSWENLKESCRTLSATIKLEIEYDRSQRPGCIAIGKPGDSCLWCARIAHRPASHQPEYNRRSKAPDASPHG
jgi:hypothetical protein